MALALGLLTAIKTLLRLAGRTLFSFELLKLISALSSPLPPSCSYCMFCVLNIADLKEPKGFEKKISMSLTEFSAAESGELKAETEGG